jgi:hypothetical protein
MLCCWISRDDNPASTGWRTVSGMLPVYFVRDVPGPYRLMPPPPPHFLELFILKELRAWSLQVFILKDLFAPK